MTTTPANTIAEQLVAAKRNADLWKQEYDRLAAQLTAGYEAGDVPSKLSVKGASLSLSPGRTTWQYSPTAKAAIKDYQTHAQQTGEATQVTGNPFWTIRFTA